jgi:phosphohistidine phosphatase
MRRLSLLRHAKSSWDDTSLDDFHRPLNERGWKSAKAMGHYLAEQNAVFDLVLASPAERVVQTLEGLANGGWEGGPVRIEKSIYDASFRELMNLVRSIPDEAQSALLVAHNPGIGMLAGQLARESRLRNQAAAKYPTGALVELELDIEAWSQAGAGCGSLTAFITPRSLLED